MVKEDSCLGNGLKEKVGSEKSGLGGNWDFAYAMSVEIPSADYKVAREKMRVIMRTFQEILLGKKWYLDHWPFLCFADEDILDIWTFTALLTTKYDFAPDVLDFAIDATGQYYRLAPNSIRFEKMGYVISKVVLFCLGEWVAKTMGWVFDDDDGAELIFPSERLLKLER